VGAAIRSVRPVEDLTRPPKRRAAARLHKAALSYPETHEDHPWGERAYKVAGKKVFMFLHELAHEGRGQGFGVTLKLPFRAADALVYPWAEPAGYGMGKHGWVSMRFTSAHEPPIEQLLDWLDESYRAVAPKRLVKVLTPLGPAR
jgi:predicted DNA-binding protein (MmcQ/YjbR family)